MVRRALRAAILLSLLIFIACRNSMPVFARTVSENSESVNTSLENTVKEEMTLSEYVVDASAETLEYAGADIVHSGTDGDLDWNIDADGVLRISGEGDYVWHTWTAYKSEIKTAIVEVSGITSASYMFVNCENLTTLDVSDFDTSKITKMDYMFFACDSLTTLDVSGFDTSLVTSMIGVLDGCNNLTSIIMPAQIMQDVVLPSSAENYY